MTITETLEKKRNVVMYLLEHENETVADVVRRFQVPRTDIYKWKKQDRLFEEKNLRYKKRVSGGGRKPETLAYEDQILLWIKEMNRHGHPPSRPIIMAYVRLRFKDFKDKTAKATSNWLSRF